MRLLIGARQQDDRVVRVPRRQNPATPETVGFAAVKSRSPRIGMPSRSISGVASACN